MALVDHEGVAERRRVDLIGAEQEYDLDLTPVGRGQDTGDVVTAFARDQAKVETADPRRGGVQNVEAVPVVLDHTVALGDRARGRENRCAVGARERAATENQHRPLGLLAAACRTHACRPRPRQTLRTGAESSRTG